MAKGLRSQPEIERRLSRYVYPTWEKREFAAIKRSDIAKLLDSIQDNHGAQQADKVLADVGAIMRWHASRDDNYRAVLAVNTTLWVKSEDVRHVQNSPRGRMFRDLPTSYGRVMRKKTSASVDDVNRIRDFLFPPDARHPRHRPADHVVGMHDLFLLFSVLYIAEKDGQDRPACSFK